MREHEQDHSMGIIISQDRSAASDEGKYADEDINVKKEDVDKAHKILYLLLRACSQFYY